jgi:hypothetical protein
MKIEKFRKLDKMEYSKITRFLKKNTLLTTREWLIANLCADFKNSKGGSQMKWIGENLPRLAPFMKEPYTRQEVSNAQAAFKKKVRRCATTFIYAYYAGLITQEETLDMIHQIVKDSRQLIETAEKEVSEDHDEEVQRSIAEIFRRINEAFAEGGEV